MKVSIVRDLTTIAILFPGEPEPQSFLPVHRAIISYETGSVTVIQAMKQDAIDGSTLSDAWESFAVVHRVGKQYTDSEITEMFDEIRNLGVKDSHVVLHRDSPTRSGPPVTPELMAMFVVAIPHPG
jgi:hypothetical protein